MQYDEDEENELLEQRFLRLENLQRSTAQFVALDHRAITAITEQINKIMTQYDGNIHDLMNKTDTITSGLNDHVLQPISELKQVANVQHEMIRQTQNVVLDHKAKLD